MNDKVITVQACCMADCVVPATTQVLYYGRDGKHFATREYCDEHRSRVSGAQTRVFRPLIARST